MSDNKINNTSNQNEVEMPTPDRKNDDITTTEQRDNQQQPEKQEQNTQQQNTQQNTTDNQEQSDNSSRDKLQAGFETDAQKTTGAQNEQHKRMDNDKQPEERKNPDNPKYQDVKQDAKQDAKQNADWQQEKLNEANNQQGNNQKGKEGSDVDEKGMPRDEKLEVNKEAGVSDKDKERGNLGDTRKDSITDRPKTETYEQPSKEDTPKAIKEGNYQHTREEEKRKTDNNSSGGSIKNSPDAGSKKQGSPVK